jgi:hypothetical protein
MTRRSSLLLQVDVPVPPSVPAQLSSVGITEAQRFSEIAVGVSD